MSGALSGVKIVDLTQTLAGPTCTMHLADMGAEVIKIEPPAGDMMRQWGPPYVGENGSYFLMFNRNKRSLTLNLRSEGGYEVFRRLADSADVVVESFRPDVKARLKIDYETLSAVNPGLVYGSLSGFGQTGPYASRGGFDPIAQAMSGVMSVTGTEATGPLKAGIPIGDYLAGTLLALGIVAALNERHNSGQGQEVDTSLLEALVGALCMHGANHLATGERPRPKGNDHPSQSPYGSFKTADGAIMIAAGNQPMWERLAEALELQGLIDDERFLSVADRVENRAELTAELEAVLTTGSTAEWQAVMDRAGIAAGPINHVDQAFKDPQVLHQGMLQSIEHPVLGMLKTVGCPINFGRTPATYDGPPPLLGADSDEILAELGYSAEEINGLKESGAV